MEDQPLKPDRKFSPPPEELMYRWMEESRSRPTPEAASNYIAYKASEWGFNDALSPDPNSLKSKALRYLDRIEQLEVVSIWIGKEAITMIREALNSIPNN
jgi:hypothetical protein